MKKILLLLVLSILFVSANTTVYAKDFEAQSDVLLDYVWTIEFNQEVDSSTVNTNNIYISYLENSQQQIYPTIPIVLSNNKSKIELRHVGDENFMANHTYTIHVKDGIKDIDGNVLKEDYVKTFTTVEGVETDTKIEWASYDNGQITGEGSLYIYVKFTKEMTASGQNGVAQTSNYIFDGSSLPAGSQILRGIEGITSSWDGVTIIVPEYSTLSGSHILSVSNQLSSTDGEILSGPSEIEINAMEPPIISITGDNPMELTVSDTYVEQGAVTNDGSIITITGNVLNEAGTYEVVYTATNPVGTTTATRNVVVEAIDSASPTLVFVNQIDNNKLKAIFSEEIDFTHVVGSFELFSSDYSKSFDLSVDNVKSNEVTLIVNSNDTLENGSYILFARTISDLAGNVSATISKRFDITGNTNVTEPPVISIVGYNPMKLELSDTYVEQGAVTNDGSTITITGNVLNEVGTYEVVYTATNSAGTTTATRTVIVVEVIDSASPTLVSVNQIDNNKLKAIFSEEIDFTHVVGSFELFSSDYSKSFDLSVDNVKSNEVTLIINSSDTLENGSYKLIARSISDLAGNVSATLIKNVTITVSSSVTEPPVISIIGDNPIELTTSDTYVEHGAVTNDGSAVTITGNVLNEIGTYEVVYTATNSVGTTTATRTVIVKAEDVDETGTRIEWATYDDSKISEEGFLYIYVKFTKEMKATGANGVSRTTTYIFNGLPLPEGSQILRGIEDTTDAWDGVTIKIPGYYATSSPYVLGVSRYLQSTDGDALSDPYELTIYEHNTLSTDNVN
ncbi:immunoglobulin-like domain-containing protein [Wukongibacter sp. M2B1]|uniref:immunoglobulin-like domain-containing protein n=1 Tax=Wukongibacter sp. M2B1 TaxID=3088895 RepID=UPI003D7B4EB9